VWIGDVGGFIGDPGVVGDEVELEGNGILLAQVGVVVGIGGIEGVKARDVACDERVVAFGLEQAVPIDEGNIPTKGEAHV
jgi:hypothetical protein